MFDRASDDVPTELTLTSSKMGRAQMTVVRGTVVRTELFVKEIDRLVELGVGFAGFSLFFEQFG